jgi:RNA-directed DNA polymerase
MALPWFRKRGYRHFDVPVGTDFAKRVQDPDFVTAHAFSPLIHFTKHVRRYKPKKGAVEIKKRPIMYASHRDACILSYYNTILNLELEHLYAQKGLTTNVIAYRKLGKSNYHFANEALEFALKNYLCTVLAYDVSKFFDTLDHKLLKQRLKRLLGCEELSYDWYAVFRHVTQYRRVEYDDLKQHPLFKARIEARQRCPIATLRELKMEGVTIHRNPDKVGIPQGTPISSSLANLYLVEFDVVMAAYAREIGGFYRRYSDDILFICQELHADEAKVRIEENLRTEKLSVSDDKTEETVFHPSSPKAAQYLGFRLHASGASIRPSSMSRQMRKLKWGVKRAFINGNNAIAAGSPTKVHTKKIRKRFTKLPVRNFSSYGRRSANELASSQVLRQVRRLEKKFHQLVEGYRITPP